MNYFTDAGPSVYAGFTRCETELERNLYRAMWDVVTFNCGKRPSLTEADLWMLVDLRLVH